MSTPERIANLIRLVEDQPTTLQWFDAEQAYLRDLSEAELHTFDGGHWLLETHLGEVIPLVRTFLSRPTLRHRWRP